MLLIRVVFLSSSVAEISTYTDDVAVHMADRNRWHFPPHPFHFFVHWKINNDGMSQCSYHEPMQWSLYRENAIAIESQAKDPFGSNV